MGATAKALGLLGLLALLSGCVYHPENEPADFSADECIEGWNAALHPAEPETGGPGGVRWLPSDRPEPLSSVGFVAPSALLRNGTCEIAFDLGDGQAFLFEVAPGYRYWQEAGEGLIWDAAGPRSLAAYVDDGPRSREVCQNGDGTLELGDGCQAGAGAVPVDVRARHDRAVARQFSADAWWIGSTWRDAQVRRVPTNEVGGPDVAVYVVRTGAAESTTVAIATVRNQYGGVVPYPVTKQIRVAPGLAVAVAGDVRRAGEPHAPLPAELVAEIEAALRPVWPLPASR
jgi:hypothetical protein